MIEQPTKNTLEILKHLADTLDARKQAVNTGTADSTTSYTAKLFTKGDDAILKKIGEEATEVVLAAKDCRYAQADIPAKKQLLVGEVADLWFHSLLVLTQFSLRPEDVLAELNRREGISGIAEKAARKD